MSERNKIDKGRQEKEEPFYAGQTRVLEMVAANAPLPEVLTNLVLLMEAQAEGMLCSILVLTADGLRACWSTPIFSHQGDVIGSFAMYRQEQRGPNAEEAHLTQIATHIAGIAIDRQRQQEILRE